MIDCITHVELELSAARACAVDGSQPILTGWYRDYVKFHNRHVARTVSNGSPEVTAKITVLEDLGATQADWSKTALPGGDPQPLKPGNMRISERNTWKPEKRMTLIFVK